MICQHSRVKKEIKACKYIELVFLLYINYYLTLTIKPPIFFKLHNKHRARTELSDLQKVREPSRQMISQNVITACDIQTRWNA